MWNSIYFILKDSLPRRSHRPRLELSDFCKSSIINFFYFRLFYFRVPDRYRFYLSLMFCKRLCLYVLLLSSPKSLIRTVLFCLTMEFYYVYSYVSTKVDGVVESSIYCVAGVFRHSAYYMYCLVPENHCALHHKGTSCGAYMVRPRRTTQHPKGISCGHHR